MQKGVYPYQHMDDWESSDETLPEKEDFYCCLDMKVITDADFTHKKRV